MDLVVIGNRGLNMFQEFVMSVIKL
ncbi:hypothetical protein [Paenibacillus sp. PL2-23]